MLFFIQTRRMY